MFGEHLVAAEQRGERPRSFWTLLQRLAVLAAGRAKRDAPELVDAAGVPLATKEPFSWVRVQLSVSMVPPKDGGYYSLDLGPRTLRVSVYAPKSVLLALLGLAAAAVPEVRTGCAWLLQHWPR